MGCVPFFIDDPLSSIKNYKSLLPRKDQCINEKLNILAFFSGIFSIILGAFGVTNSWLFGVLGLVISIILKLTCFHGDNGKKTVDQYKQSLTMDQIQEYLPHDKPIHGHIGSDEFADMADEAHFIIASPHRLDNGVDIRDAVINDNLQASRPLIVPLTSRLGDICIA